MCAATLNVNAHSLQIRACRRPVYKTRFPAGTSFRFTPLRTPAAGSTIAETVVVSTDDADVVVESRANILACPICYDQVVWNGGCSRLSTESVRGTNLQCNTCRKTYYANEALFDLTVSSGAKDYVESKPLATEWFRTPLMGFFYERGWRQNFGAGGYPGRDREFEMAKDYLSPILGGTIVDASCGSGLFSRLFAKSGLFSLVIALDYSEAMLKQCYEFINEEQGFPRENLILVRADIARLPFLSGSVDAVHAGAALHCWPSPSQAVAEISRVLRPGGVFVASTTIADGPVAVLPFTRNLRDYLMDVAGSRVFLSEQELEDLTRACGLVDFTCLRNGPFIMMGATKPK